MNYFSFPMVYGFVLMPTVTLPVQQPPSPIPLPEIEYKPEGPATLEESEHDLNRFKEALGELVSQPLSLNRLQISERGNERVLQPFPPFQEIFHFAIVRYKQNYREDQRKTSWGRSDCQLFLWVLDKYCHLHNKTPEEFQLSDWGRVSRMVPFRSAHGCMFKWLSLRKQKLEQYPWLPEEEQHLFGLADSSGKNDWVQISRQLFSKFSQCYRSPKQCREHWSLHLNSLHDRAKKLWAREEDLKLMQSFKSRGRRWKEISRELVGRSENAIKNRFTLIMKKYGGDLERVSLEKRTSIIIKRLTEAVERQEQSEQELQEKLDALEELSELAQEQEPLD